MPGLTKLLPINRYQTNKAGIIDWLLEYFGSFVQRQSLLVLATDRLLRFQA